MSGTLRHRWKVRFAICGAWNLPRDYTSMLNPVSSPDILFFTVLKLRDKPFFNPKPLKKDRLLLGELLIVTKIVTVNFPAHLV